MSRFNKVQRNPKKRLYWKLVKRLREELKLNVPDDVMIKRTYAGRNQKSAGAWCSWLHSESNISFEIGMYVPVAQLLKCPKLLIGDSYGTYVDCGCLSGRCKGLKEL